MAVSKPTNNIVFVRLLPLLSPGNCKPYKIC